MNNLQDIDNRLVSNRRGILADAQVRYGLTGLRVDGRLNRAMDSFIDALATTLATEDVTTVQAWVSNERGSAPALHLREAVHAICMAVGAETANLYRSAFRDVMGILQRVEMLVAKLVGEAELLKAAA